MLFDYKQPGTGALMIARPEEQASHICAKATTESIADCAQLVVGDGECAVLARGGQIAGILGPGRHTLPAQQANIFFVTTNPIERLQFGGPTDQLMVFGSVTTRVVDPGRLATVLGPATTEDLSRYLGQKILALAEACANEWLGSYFTLDTIGNAGRELAQAIQPHCTFCAELGLELPRFESLTLKARR